jgi:hypothetical protein
MPKSAAGKSPAARRSPAARSDGGMKQKAYASFDAYAADQTAFHRRLIAPLRRFVAATAPDLVESVKWGNGCWLAGKTPVAYVYAGVDHLQFGFFRGASLRDPLGLLHGKGQYVRHAKLRRPADLDRAAFGALLQQAVGCA